MPYLMTRYFIFSFALLICLAVIAFSLPINGKTAGNANDTLISLKPIRMCGAPLRPKNDRELNCLRGEIHFAHRETVPLIKRDGAYVDGHPTQLRDAIYNRQGNATEEVVYGFDFNYAKHVDSRVVFTYDSNGRATGWEDYADGLPVPAISKYIYNEKGYKVKAEVTRADGTVRATSSFTYDAKGRSVEALYENSEGMSGRSIIDTYDDNGNLIRQVSRNTDGSMFWTGIYKYNAQGNRIDEQTYQTDSQGKVISNARIASKYDEQGFRVEEYNYGADGALKTKVVFAYDNKSSITSITAYKSDGTFNGRSLYSYEYDAQGNWTKCVHLNQKTAAAEPEAYYVEYRTLTYY
ncbi:MAG TPA: hypothetical protein VGC66_01965 [Pyrinomonadaceae bacterium]|jgi:hypothetical protein